MIIKSLFMVSFILPAYKSQFLEQSIDSILNQKFADFELIIVNDNPGSEISSLVSSYDDIRIRYYENSENKGQTDLVSFWNDCLRLSRGEFIVLASDDDLYEPEYLEILISITKKYPSVDLFHCRLSYIDASDNIIQIAQPSLEYETQTDFIYNLIFWRRKQSLQEFMFRKSAIEKIGGLVNFPFAWSSDHATMCALAENGVAYSSEVLFKMRMSSSNISSGSNLPYQKMQALKKYTSWLDGFLPGLKAETDVEIFHKTSIRKYYRSILHSDYFSYLPLLSLNQFLKEIRYIRKNRIAGRNRIFREIARRLGF